MVMSSAKKKSYWKEDGDVPLLQVTIPQHFFNIAEKFARKDAVVSLGQKRRLSYGELSEEVLTVAGALIAAGFKKGDRVGVWSTNNIEWILLQMATAVIGVVLVNINPACRVKELEYTLKRSEVQGLFFIPKFKNSNYADMVLELFPEIEKGKGELNSKNLPFLKTLVIFDPLNIESSLSEYPEFTSWQDFIKKGCDVSKEEVMKACAGLNIHDPINIQYTSGTTGFPKAVLLTHFNILNNAYFSALALRFTERDRLCVPVPFYHCFGMVLANLLCFTKGAAIVIPSEHFDPLEVLKAIEKEKCTALHGVPTMFIAELEHPEFKSFDLSTLRTGIMAGATCPPALMKKVIADMHLKEILIGYGQTEASPLTHLTRIGDSFEKRTETVGKNLPHQEVKVVDVEKGNTLPTGEEGEICFRGYHIMKGYYNDAQATAEAMDKEGWLHSGDLGNMDEEGYVQITGRLKDMIIRGGENIYPREIEDFLFTHEKIAEVAVFGIPDEYYGEEIMAWIELHEGESLTEEEVKAFCKDKIAHFKIPKYIWFVSEFPMTVTGKLQKFRMREIAVKKMKKDA